MRHGRVSIARGALSRIPKERERERERDDSMYIVSGWMGFRNCKQPLEYVERRGGKQFQQVPQLVQIDPSDLSQGFD